MIKNENWVPPYTEEKVASLCRTLRVSQEYAAAVKKNLNHGAERWHYVTHSPAYFGKPKEIRDELYRLAKSVSAAKSAISSVTDAAWNAMQYASDCVNFDHYESKIDTVADNGLFETADNYRTIYIVDQPHDIASISLSQFKEALRLISELAHIGAQVVPDLRRGPPRDYALEEWMRLAYYAVSATPAHFRIVTSTDGSPTSPAACFCVEAYALLSPATPRSRVLHEMKRCKANLKSAH